MEWPKVESWGNYVEGRWYDGLINELRGPIERGDDDEARKTWTSVCPANSQHVVGVVDDGAELVPVAVPAARDAHERWHDTPLETRCAILDRFVEALGENAADLALLITAETGKPITEARAEVKALAKKWTVTKALAKKHLRDHHVEGVPGFWDYRPIGVMAVIGPFNFPLHLAHGQILPALVSGNAVIFKPSEKTPMVGERYVRIWEGVMKETGAPDALLQLVQGSAEVGERICRHGGIGAIAFTGSYEVGRKIVKGSTRWPERMIALEMGGKNPVFIMPDADLELAARESVLHAFRTTGQRCTATSRVVVHESVYDRFVPLLLREAARWRPSDPRRDDCVMGPLIDREARDRFEVAQLSTRGMTTLLKGGSCPGPAPGFWVSPAIHRIDDQAQVIDRVKREIFGPEILLETWDDEGAALWSINATPWGLACSIFTESEETFRRMRHELRFGLINWNRGTSGASGRMPFGGMGQSGNMRPAGSFALYFCIHPVATLYPDDFEDDA